MAKRRRGWTIAVVVLTLLVLAVVILASVADEPLRRYVEGEANSALPGFHVSIGQLDLHPLTLSVQLRDVVVRQDIHPDPPVLSIPQVTADAQLAPLFSGRVGADVGDVEQRQREVGQLQQEAVQGRLVDDVAADDGRAVALVGDGQAVEPRAPARVQVTLNPDLVALAGVAVARSFTHTRTVRRDLVSADHHMW